MVCMRHTMSFARNYGFKLRKYQSLVWLTFFHLNRFDLNYFKQLSLSISYCVYILTHFNNLRSTTLQLCWLLCNKNQINCQNFPIYFMHLNVNRAPQKCFILKQFSDVTISVQRYFEAIPTDIGSDHLEKWRL